MRSHSKKIMLINFLVYFAFRLFLLVIYLMPFRLVALLGSFLGKTYYLIDRTRRRFANANISVVFGRKLDNKKREILGRESCAHLAMSIFDLLKLNKIITPENYHEYIEITGSSNLMKSIKRGKGTIAVTGHFGNFYLFTYLSYLDIPPMAAVIRELDNPYLERLLASIFNKLDVTIERPDGAISNMHYLLLKNAIVVTLADQKAGGNPRVGRHGVVVDFFGIPSQTHITAPLLARRTGASIVPLFVIREGPGRYRIEINEPLKPVRTSDEASDLKKNTRKINQIFESYITKYPNHWLWLHRRWKDIPGLEDLYNTNNPLRLVENFRRRLEIR
ncbi:MAG: lysophospholipid acyltransferase family protein [Deltaproteobacteria bacterium]|nr:lysophospholipid acyltransferase family protein [Deltaproteobacteria bacterium]MBW2105435.1 lysophospholipid acyltransferase family protein [Deltaproteobacteria bacterium]MBW2332265.1 lysophospholipid acyltransferase family protein [Deltaproteobacteria bacterium]